MARSHKRTWLYVGREFLLSFSVAFLFFFFIFFVNQILVMAEEIFAKQVPFWDVVRLVAYSLPWVVMMSFPFGSLVGALMAVGRIASDNEALAFAASGVPPRQLLVPLLVLGVAFSAVSFVMNDYFLPLGTIRYAEIYRRIVYSNPSLEIEPLSIKKLDDVTVVTGTVEGQTFRNVVLIDRSAERNRRVITARSARLEERERGVVSLVLEGVFTHASFPREGDRYDYTTSGEMVYNISLKSIAASLGTPTPSQQSSVDVWRQIGVEAGGRAGARRGSRRPGRRPRLGPRREPAGALGGRRPGPVGRGRSPPRGRGIAAAVHGRAGPGRAGPQPPRLPAGVPLEVRGAGGVPRVRLLRLAGGPQGPAQRPVGRLRDRPLRGDRLLGHARRRAHLRGAPERAARGRHVAARRGGPRRGPRRGRRRGREGGGETARPHAPVLVRSGLRRGDRCSSSCSCSSSTCSAASGATSRTRCRSSRSAAIAMLYTPKCVAYSLPIAFLFAVSFTLGQLYARGELAAILGSGVSLYRLVAPFLALGVLLSAASFFFEDAIVIPTFRQRNAAWSAAVKAVTSLSQANVTVASPDQREVYQADYYNDAQRRLTGLTVIVRASDLALRAPAGCRVGGVDHGPLGAPRLPDLHVGPRGPGADGRGPGNDRGPDLRRAPRNLPAPHAQRGGDGVPGGARLRGAPAPGRLRERGRP